MQLSPRSFLLASALLVPAFAVTSLNCGSSDADATTGAGAGASVGSNTSGTAQGGSSGTATASGGASSAGGNGGATTSAAGGAGTGGQQVPSGPKECDNKLYQCGNTIDDDGDGLIDEFDPDCLGPCDNTEDSFYPDLPGNSADNCTLDCYWDGGNGSDEGCYWDHRCDPLAVAPNYPPEGAGCEYDASTNLGSPPNLSCTDAFNDQSMECLDFCKPLSPNGCDCFGCCEIPQNPGNYVWIGSQDGNGGTCTMAGLNDPALCQPCTPVPGCLNPCGKCELCFGKTVDDLPPECFPGGGSGGGSTTGSGGNGGAGGGGDDAQCPPELQACGLPGQDPCPGTEFCITGCCIKLN